MIRLAVVSLFLVGSEVLACPMPPGAIPLASKAHGAPLGYARMDTPPLSAPFKIEITFCDLAKGAKALEFDAIMPAHKHGMNFDVDVAEMADKRFEVSNVVFHMQGLWEIRIDVELDGQTHAYTAEVMLE
ncbi:MAG: hypothetical protein AAF543_15005 [Pseudomonadota bacterium]